MRKYAKQCGAKNPELLTSCRLRKHIATVTQILSLKTNEIDQLAKFMGHTSKTHENFYKLPQDIYQVAKVSKILQLMEKGNAAEFKNKCLEEIDIDMENVEEDEFNELEAESDGNIVLGIAQNDNNDVNIVEENKNTIDTSKSSNKRSGNSCSQKKGSRQRWNNEQKQIMQVYFKQQIKKKNALRKNECEEFLNKYKNKFKDVSWVRVKTFLFNACRLQPVD
ncbi:unnamed protein product [Brassicogethes aeneus]|uniref:Uncharacterized protein n=1 Tax=Brassicogethes aeneus TaxID=1431903 RepID=A0A9P0AWU4_BRAAE|nr:unnamed protein product [Brassicogethes aeneus]